MNNLKIYTAKYLFVAVVLIWVWVWFRQSRDKKIQLLAATVGAGVIALIISRIAGKLYYDPRPFVSQHITPLIPHAADNGFPSDHALLTSTLSAVLYPIAKNWAIIAGVITVLVGIGRVAVHIHSPIDIIGAFAIGLVSAWLGWLLTRKFVSKGADAQPHDQKYKPKEQ